MRGSGGASEMSQGQSRLRKLQAPEGAVVRRDPGGSPFKFHSSALSQLWESFEVKAIKVFDDLSKEVAAVLPPSLRIELFVEGEVPCFYGGDSEGRQVKLRLLEDGKAKGPSYLIAAYSAHPSEEAFERLLKEKIRHIVGIARYLQ